MSSSLQLNDDDFDKETVLTLAFVDNPDQYKITYAGLAADERFPGKYFVGITVEYLDADEVDPKSGGFIRIPPDIAEHFLSWTSYDHKPEFVDFEIQRRFASACFDARDMNSGKLRFRLN